MKLFTLNLLSLVLFTYSLGNFKKLQNNPTRTKHISEKVNKTWIRYMGYILQKCLLISNMKNKNITLISVFQLQEKCTDRVLIQGASFYNIKAPVYTLQVYKFIRCPYFYQLMSKIWKCENVKRGKNCNPKPKSKSKIEHLNAYTDKMIRPLCSVSIAVHYGPHEQLLTGTPVGHLQQFIYHSKQQRI